MVLACRLAGTDNAVPSLPGSDSWLSKKKQKKIFRSLFQVQLHFRCCRNILDLVDNKRCMSGSSCAFVRLCNLCDLLTITVRDKPGHCSTGLWQWCNGKAIEALAGGAPSNSSLMLFEKVSFRATTPAPVIVRATFLNRFTYFFFVLFLWKLSKQRCHRFFYSFPTISGDETKSGFSPQSQDTLKNTCFCTFWNISEG